MAQTWERLLFAHWPVPAQALRPLVPPRIPIDTFEGSAWIGITPFRITGMRPRGLPPIPVLSSFLETNVRTYVSIGERPGIWFLSLDAESRLAVAAARRAYRLPYFRARMSDQGDGAWIEYESARDSPGGPTATLRTRYRPVGEVFEARPQSLEHFLTERYCLYTLHRGQVMTADIHHPPWQLQPAEASFSENTLVPALGSPGAPAAEETAPLLHFSRRQDVVIWPLRKHGEP
jgi:uncharacterized protein YqjF (DUF2071 family)